MYFPATPLDGWTVTAFWLLEVHRQRMGEWGIGLASPEFGVKKFFHVIGCFWGDLCSFDSFVTQFDPSSGVVPAQDGKGQHDALVPQVGKELGVAFGFF